MRCCGLWTTCACTQDRESANVGQIPLRKKKIHGNAIMIRYTQKNVHSLFNGKDDVDKDGRRTERESAWTSSTVCILYEFYLYT